MHPSLASNRAPLIGALGLLALSACRDLTKVSAPDVLQPPAVQNPAGAGAAYAGAIAAFEVAIGQAALYSGLLTDELTTQYPGDVTDPRSISDGAGAIVLYPYSQLVGARVNALVAVGLLQTYVPSARAMIGEMFAIDGYTEVLLAEDVCAGVPLSHVIKGVPVAGPPLTTPDVLHQALMDFDSARTYAGDSGRVPGLALVGRARALLDLDSAAAAAAVADSVATPYVYAAAYAISPPSEQNDLALNLQSQAYTVSDREGISGLNFASAGDPRLPVTFEGSGSDGVNNYIPVPDATTAAPIVVASGVEARLIVAEGALRAGDPVTWAAVLDSLRTDSSETGVRGLSPLTLDSTTTASAPRQIDVMFRERAFWLFGTVHRQGDLRRLIRQYGRTQDQVFPTGPYSHAGLQYGSDVTFPITGENGNPQVPECLNRQP